MEKRVRGVVENDVIDGAAVVVTGCDAANPPREESATIAGRTIIAIPLDRIFVIGRIMMTATLYRGIRLACCRKNASSLARTARSNLDTICRLIQLSENRGFRPA